MRHLAYRRAPRRLLTTDPRERPRLQGNAERVALPHRNRLDRKAHGEGHGLRVMCLGKSEQYCTCPVFVTLASCRMKIRPTKHQLLSFPPPTCGAAIKEPCELNIGYPRHEPH